MEKSPVKFDVTAGAKVWADQSHLWGGFNGIVKMQPEGYVLQHMYTKFIDYYHNFEFQEGDVLVSGHPKTGTTWIQDVVWTMTHNQDCKPIKASVFLKSPTIEGDAVVFSSDIADHPDAQTFKVTLQQLQEEENVIPSKDIFPDGEVVNEFPVEGVGFPFWLHLSKYVPTPRIFKGHAPISMYRRDLTDKCKVVYIVRNPKDSLVSMFRFLQCYRPMNFKGSFSELFELFINEKLPFHPFWVHFNEAWSRRDEPNIHVIFYENMKSEPLGELQKLNKFLNTNLTEAQLINMTEFISFKATKAREGPSITNYVDEDKGSLFRKGTGGDWKNYFTPDQTDRMNDWIRKNTSELSLPLNYSE